MQVGMYQLYQQPLVLGFRIREEVFQGGPPSGAPGILEAPQHLFEPFPHAIRQTKGVTADQQLAAGGHDGLPH